MRAPGHTPHLRPALLLTLALAVSCDQQRPPEPVTAVTAPAAEVEVASPAAPESKPEPSSEPVTDARKHIADIDNDVAFYAARGGPNGKKSALDMERVASGYMRLARLTASYDDYAKADAALEAAFANAPKGGGPLLTRASLNATLHRFDKVAPDLDAFAAQPLRSNRQQASVASLRGDLALQRGDLRAAGAHYKEALGHHKATPHMVRMAHLLQRQGDTKEATRLLDEAIDGSKRDGPMLQSWVVLQRGLLELGRGRLEEADAFYARAASIFSGWYLIIEHRAEILTLTGRAPTAEVLYRKILAETPCPEFMDALADALEAQDKDTEANKWRDEATATYRAQLQRFPEATYGHALPHFLTVDPPFALTLANKNHALRPSPEAKIALAMALIVNKRAKDALPHLNAAEDTGWATPDLFATLHYAHAHLQNTTEADSYKARALKASPAAIDDLDWLAP